MSPPSPFRTTLVFFRSRSTSWSVWRSTIRSAIEPLREITLAVAEAVDNVLRHAFRPEEKATFTILARPVAGGLEVSIRDKGLPYHPDLEDSGTEESGLEIMSRHADNLSFVNLGHLGKEVRLLKMATTKKSWDQIEAPHFDQKSFSKEDLVVRRMLARDAVEVSRCFYEVYGYDYGNDTVYEPSRLIEMNEQGLLLTIVASTPEGYLLGTEALERSSTDTLIYEAGMAAVRPEARHFGVAGAMARFMGGMLMEERIPGVWASCVTSHTFSQRTVPPGCQACLLLPGNKPADHTLAIPQKQRNTVLLLYKDLNHTPPRPTLYAPSNHKGICEEILHGFGWEPQWGDAQPGALEGNTEAIYDLNRARGRVVGWAKKYGADFVEGAREKHNFLRTHGYSAIYAFLPMTDPYTIEAVRLLEGWGYFFSGIFPGTGHNDPYLGMTFLNNVILDYDQVHVLDPFGQKLRDYVKALDPEQKPL